MNMYYYFEDDHVNILEKTFFKANLTEEGLQQLLSYTYNVILTCLPLWFYSDSHLWTPVACQSQNANVSRSDYLVKLENPLIKGVSS